MSLKVLTKKIKDLHEVWDNYPIKLIIWLKNATGLQGTKKVCCRVFVGGQKYKSKLLKCGDDVSWDEVLFFVPNQSDEVRLEFWDEHLRGDVFLGEANLATVGQMQVETAMEISRPLVEGTGKKKKKAKVGGQVSISYLLSNLTETRPAMGRDDLHFNYKPFYEEMRTGDLLLYEGTGLVPTLTKLQENKPYTQVGVVLRLPNKWTNEIEHFVVEYTRNFDNFSDAFSETKDRTGWNIFRCKERIHQYHGSRVWLCKLKPELLKDESQNMNLIEHIWELHGHQTHVSGSFQKTSKVSSILSDFFTKNQYQASLIDLEAASLFMNAFKSCHLVVNAFDEKKFISVSEVLGVNCWEEPIVIRQAEPFSSTAGPTISTPTFAKGKNPQERFAPPATIKLQHLVSSGKLSEAQEDFKKSLASEEFNVDVAEQVDDAATVDEPEVLEEIETIAEEQKVEDQGSLSVANQEEVSRTTVYHEQAIREELPEAAAVVEPASAQAAPVQQPATVPRTAQVAAAAGGTTAAAAAPVRTNSAPSAAAVNVTESQSIPRKRACGKIPIIMERASNCPLAEFPNSKTVMPGDSTCDDLKYAVQFRLKLDESVPLSLFVGDHPLKPEDKLEDFYQASKSADGYLHVTYTDRF